jgi:exonuclease III
VIKNLKTDIIALQEVENENTLIDLNKKLNYPYYAITKNYNANTNVALLSKYKIIKTVSIEVSTSANFRDILEVHLKINDSKLILFVVHWHSKFFPETYRRQYAQALKWRIDDIKDDQDFIILGDFNSNYDEYLTFKKDKRLNDTFGITGINDIIKTTKDSRMITREYIIEESKGNEYLYNLWLEIDSFAKRYSAFYKNKPQSLDSIIVSPSLFDDKGINYVDRSFSVYKDDKVIRKDTNTTNSWEFSKGIFTGNGYSDHLPIYADFDSLPFAVKIDEIDTRIITSIDRLYDVGLGDGNYLIKNVVAIYQDDKGTILKDPNGRAIYVVGHNDKFFVGKRYEVDVTTVEDDMGLRVIKNVGLVVDKGNVENISVYKIHNTNKDFNNLKYQNEVIASIRGIYNKGYFEYSGKRLKETIKIVIKDENLRPKDESEVVFKDVIVGYEKQPVLIVQ